MANLETVYDNPMMKFWFNTTYISWLFFCKSLEWHHIEHDDISIHWGLDC